MRFDKRVATGRGQAAHLGDRRHARTAFTLLNRMVDLAVLRLAARDGPVTLLYAPFFEGLSEHTRCIRRQREHERAARPTIQAVHGVHVHSEAVAHRAHHIVGVVGQTAMHDRAARLVDYDTAQVAMQKRER
jgi:hypothetical protein